MRPTPSSRRFPHLALTLTLAALAFASLVAQDMQKKTSGPAALALRFELSSPNLKSDAVGQVKSWPVLADINRDGYLDLLSQGRMARHLFAWLGDGKGGWTPTAEKQLVLGDITCGGGYEVADINKDGHTDLVVGDHCTGTWVFLGDGQGNWRKVAESLNPLPAYREDLVDSPENPFKGTEDVAVADLDGDGFLDIVAGASDCGGLTVWTGDGSGAKWKEAIVTGLPYYDEERYSEQGGWVRDVQLHDMDRDGHLDVVASYHAGPKVWVGDGKGKFRPASEGLPTPMLYGVFHQLAVADLNGDKRLDLVIANQVNGPEVFLKNADGSWKATPDVMTTMFGGAWSVALGDLDGDRKPELIVGGRLQPESQFGIYVLQGNPVQGWTPLATNLPDGDAEIVWGLTAADVNGDKRVDIVAHLGGSLGKSPTARERFDLEKKGAVLPAKVQVWLNRGK